MEETYDLYTYLPEMREAMEKWESFVRAVCIDTPVVLQTAPTVTQLSRQNYS
jgi:hypothetical protein